MDTIFYLLAGAGIVLSLYILRVGYVCKMPARNAIVLTLICLVAIGGLALAGAVYPWK